MAVRFQLLGEVAADIDGRPVELGHARQRCVLAVLLVEANHSIPVATLAERVWDGRLPPSRYAALYSYLSRLRTIFARAPEARIVRRAGGYTLSVDPAAIDLARFRRLVARARTAADEGTAVDLLDQALNLWSADAFAGLDTPWLRGVRDMLHRQRLAAELDRNDIRLRRGDRTGLLDELFIQSAAHPLDERLAAQLMLALSQNGRTAEALDHYRDMRQRLVNELGIDPSPALVQMHQTILRGETTPAVAPDPQAGVPAHLPRDVSSFSGRADELGWLDSILAASRSTPTTSVVIAVTGTAGVGKTALAVHWAHRVADRFPDGQLSLNLRGFDPDGSPMAAASAVRCLLDALAVPRSRIPASPKAQARLYRSLLAGKRMLLLLDNAHDSEQVRPLLPDAPGCLALVTSRDQLTSLAVVDGANLVPLDLPSPVEAHQMLAIRLGPARVRAQPRAAEEIISRCARLPLALAIVAARAATRPRASLTVIADELRFAHGNLDPFDVGDAAVDARHVFSWSYRVLSAPAARLFRLLGVHPGPDITAAAAASLAGLTTPDAVRSPLAELCRVHLLAEHVPGRYGCHDLLRAYAAERARADEPEGGRAEATHRILDHYLRTAHAADHLLDPHRDRITLPEPRHGVTPETLGDDQQATTWFTVERPVLLAAIEQAASTGWDTHAWQLAWTLTTFLERHGHWHDQDAALQTAVAAARRLGDLSAQARSHRNLAHAAIMLDRLDDAETHLLHALELRRQTGDQTGEAHVQNSLASLWEHKMDYTRALDHAQQALRLYRAAGHRTGQANTLNMVGWYNALLGNYRRALTSCQQALILHQELGNRYGQASAMDSLGYAHHHLNNHDHASACYEQALGLFGDLGDRYAQTVVLTHLGEAHNRGGDPVAARLAWQDALTILTDLEHPDADRLRSLLLTSGEPPPAPLP